jgi:hypothetical protein
MDVSHRRAFCEQDLALSYCAVLSIAFSPYLILNTEWPKSQLTG